MLLKLEELEPKA